MVGRSQKGLTAGASGWRRKTQRAWRSVGDGGCIYVVDANGDNLRRLIEGCSVGVDLT